MQRDAFLVLLATAPTVGHKIQIEASSPGVNDPNFYVGGFGPEPIAYQIRANGFEKCGSSSAVIQTELNEMLGSTNIPGTSGNVGALVTIDPLYMNPSIDKTNVGALRAMGSGSAKEYASLRLTFNNLRIYPRFRRRSCSHGRMHGILFKTFLLPV